MVAAIDTHPIPVQVGRVLLTGRHKDYPSFTVRLYAGTATGGYGFAVSFAGVTLYGGDDPKHGAWWADADGVKHAASSLDAAQDAACAALGVGAC